MSLSRKRKKELRKLQTQATSLWESQQVLVGEAASVAREAGRQLGHLNREQVKPRVAAGYETYAAPYVEKGKRVVNSTVIPAAGAVVGSAMSVWDAANDTRSRLASGRGFDFSAFKKPAPAPVKKGMGAGGVIAIILGVAAALGVLYAAWQTLRADDELWVADDPLRAPDA
ncbi:DNA helicase [Microbacterium sp. CFH 31415]|uniref:DNA helicase n=1 Tax=Microbacterium sp. CFH 31415 TaxID=2921732 RepID=UPI001F138FD6|nr:DNA helicase [Microbacterium sp. CFH 31415]MCH6230524.1 DNA helicase [Microbacterium sp. CFH 31415]